MVNENCNPKADPIAKTYQPGAPGTAGTSLAEKWAAMGDWSPLAALKQAASTRWLVDSIIPAGSITWLVGAPGSFKTFLAMDLATCIASGRPWHGRETSAAVVLYIAAEGEVDGDLDYRRAAADIAADDTGPLRVVYRRPRLDEATGLATLMAMVYDLTYTRQGQGLQFSEVEDYMLGASYLTTDERAAIAFLSACDEPDDKTPAGMRREYDAHVDVLRPLKWNVNDGPSIAALRPRFNAWDEAIAKILEDGDLNLQYPGGLDSARAKNVLLVLDTYSQTSADDTKATVSKYVKTLRDVQEKAAALGGTITVVVIDHLTKGGDSFMGSLAKLGDSDTMAEVERHGQGNSLTLKSVKMKQGAKFQPIHLKMEPITLHGHFDADGIPLKTLAVVDGEKAHQVRQAVGANRDTAAATLLALLDGQGAISADALKQLYTSHPSNEQKKAETIARSFQRALAKLTDTSAVTTTEGGLLELGSLA